MPRDEFLMRATDCWWLPRAALQHAWLFLYPTRRIACPRWYLFTCDVNDRTGVTGICRKSTKRLMWTLHNSNSTGVFFLLHSSVWHGPHEPSLWYPTSRYWRHLLGARSRGECLLLLISGSARPWHSQADVRYPPTYWIWLRSPRNIAGNEILSQSRIKQEGYELFPFSLGKKYIQENRGKSKRRGQSLAWALSSGWGYSLCMPPSDPRFVTCHLLDFEYTFPHICHAEALWVLMARRIIPQKL